MHVNQHSCYHVQPAVLSQVYTGVAIHAYDVTASMQLSGEWSLIVGNNIACTGKY